MKVKIIKSLKHYDKKWKKYVGKIYNARKGKDGYYWIKVDGRTYPTFWEKGEIREIK